MCDTEANKHIFVCILDNLLDLPRPRQHKHQPKQKETSIMVFKFKIYFSAKKLPLIENLKIKSLMCFRHQKYFLDEILIIRLVVLHKCMACTVDKSTSTDTGHTIYIY